MSFLSGPECSTGANPLSQFSKHTQADTSLQRDRVVGQSGPQAFRDGFKTQDGSAEQANRAFQEFHSQPPVLPNMALPPFDIELMKRQMANLELQSLRAHDPSERWAQEIQPELVPRQTSPYSVDEFQNFQASLPTSSSHQAATAPSMSSSLQSPAYHAPSMLQPSFHQPWQPLGMFPGPSHAPWLAAGLERSHIVADQTVLGDEGKGKARVTELDDQQWEAQFAELEKLEPSPSVTAHLPTASETLHDGDLESLWKGILSNRENEAAFNTDPSVKVDLSDLSDVKPQLPDLTSLEHPDWTDFDAPSFENFRAFNQEAELGTYQFDQERENAFASLPNPYEEGLKILRDHGNLTLATMAFEAAVQRDETHAPAWMRLGQTQASNEMEAQAIRALERAVTLKPESTEALMSLAISYTNESRDQLALRSLEKWLSVRYPAILPPETLTPVAETGFTDPDALRAKVTNGFLRAAQQAPSGAAMDPDVQIGLGVLFYTAGTYSKAIDCFQAALDSSEESPLTDPTQSHLLWNRLGATLANSARPEEAIAAYERALELNPSFTRARYNLGVSCVNMGFYREAAGHLLDALAMHQKGEQEASRRAKEITGKNVEEGTFKARGESSANLMETLVRCFVSMQRRDLVESVVPGMNVEEVRGRIGF